eukprot:g17958.t1
MLERWRKDCKISPETEIEIIEQVPAKNTTDSSEKNGQLAWTLSRGKTRLKSTGRREVLLKSHKTLRKLFRNVYMVGVQAWSLSTALHLRILEIANGDEDLQLLPSGELGDHDPGANYSSPQIVQEMIRTTADVVSEDLGKDLLAAGSWSFALDESEDVRAVLIVLVYLKIFCERIGASKEIFFFSFRLTLPEENPSETLKAFYISLLPNSSAISNQNCDGGLKGGVNTIRCLNEFVENNDCLISQRISRQKTDSQWHTFVSGSLDGCSANFSDRVGVANLFRALVFSKLSAEEITKHPGFLPVQHCSCHRLALVVKDAFMDVDYIRNMFEPVLVELCLWYKNSPVRFESLNRAVHELFGFSMQSGFALPVAIRWLSHEKSINQIRERLPAIIKDLTASSTSKSIKPDDRARATGLLSKVNTFQSYATIYLLSDVLPILASFSKTMQSVKAELSHVLGGFSRAHQLLASFRANVSNMSYLMDLFALRHIWCFDKKVKAPFLDSLLELLLQGMIDVACPRDLFPSLRYEPAEVKNEASDDEDFLQPQSPHFRTSDDEDDFEEEKQQPPPPPPSPPPSPPPPPSNQEEELLHDASADMVAEPQFEPYFPRSPAAEPDEACDSQDISPNTVLEGLDALPAATVQAIPALSLRYKVSEVELRTEILRYNCASFEQSLVRLPHCFSKIRVVPRSRSPNQTGTSIGRFVPKR